MDNNQQPPAEEQTPQETPTHLPTSVSSLGPDPEAVEEFERLFPETAPVDTPEENEAPPQRSATPGARVPHQGLHEHYSPIATSTDRLGDGYFFGVDPARAINHDARRPPLTPPRASENQPHQSDEEGPDSPLRRDPQIYVDDWQGMRDGVEQNAAPAPAPAPIPPNFPQQITVPPLTGNGDQYNEAADLMHLVTTQRNHINFLTTSLTQANAQVRTLTGQNSFYRRQNDDLTRRNLDLANVAANRRADNIELAADATTLAEGLARVVMDSRRREGELRGVLGETQQDGGLEQDSGEERELEDGEVRDEEMDGAEAGEQADEVDEEVAELAGAWQ